AFLRTTSANLRKNRLALVRLRLLASLSSPPASQVARVRSDNPVRRASILRARPNSSRSGSLLEGVFLFSAWAGLPTLSDLDAAVMFISPSERLSPSTYRTALAPQVNHFACKVACSGNLVG